jgi:hypothetical protein
MYKGQETSIDWMMKNLHNELPFLQPKVWDKINALAKEARQKEMKLISGAWEDSRYWQGYGPLHNWSDYKREIYGE